MVNIIEDWDILAEYAGEKLGFYQLLTTDGIMEIRVQTGGWALRKSLQTATTRSYNKILDFCKKCRYLNVSENMRDDQFFK